MQILKTAALYILPLFISTLLLYSCSTQSTEKQPADSTAAVQVSEGDTDKVNHNKTQGFTQTYESDCIFDTSTFRFTTEVIKKYDPDLRYTWNDTDKEAIVPLENNDTLILHIGGCDHFGYSAIYKTDASHFQDEAYILSKALWLSRHFFTNGFNDGYVYYLTNKKYKLERDESEVKYYSIDMDSSTAENEIYDGFRIEKEENRMFIDLGGYIN